jgi:hypothetical protein
MSEPISSIDTCNRNRTGVTCSVSGLPDTEKGEPFDPLWYNSLLDRLQLRALPSGDDCWQETQHDHAHALSCVSEQFFRFYQLSSLVSHLKEFSNTPFDGRHV